MSTGIVPAVESVVDARVQNGDMFTAHDITLDVRKKGHRIGHVEVRDAVHDYYNRGGMGVAYTRTNISVPGGTPLLYHRTADDPATYANIRGGGSVVNIPPSSSTSSDDDDDDDDNSAISIPAGLLSPNGVQKKSVTNIGKRIGRTVDARQTLSLPSDLLRNLGYKPLQKVYARAENNRVEVVTACPTAGTFSEYTVDRHCQVRLTQSFLKRAGIGGASYDVSGDSTKNVVVVKLHK